MEARLGTSEPPQVLYKYRKLDAYSRRLLIENEIYFADPVRDFNDPFDCRLRMSLDGPFDDWYQKIETLLRKRNLPVNDQEISKKVQYILNNKNHDNNEWRRLEDDLHDDLITVRVENGVQTRIGVFTLTSDCKNILLFSHYADAHRGFCVGFRTFECPEVFYLKTGRYLDQVRYIGDDEFDPPNIFHSSRERQLEWKLFTKSALWSYEREWRVINYAGSGPMNIPSEVISEIILGCRMSENDRREILELAEHRHPKVPAFQAEESRTGIGLHLVRVS